MLTLLGGLMLSVCLLTLGVGAQDNFREKATKVTVTEPMQVPGGTVLTPGVYIFRLNDSNANRHIVQIFTEDESKLVTTVLAVPNSRLEPTDNGIMTYEERPVGEPVALGAWFYSGQTDGQQFVYPRRKAEQLSSMNRTEVPSTDEDYPGISPDPPRTTRNDSPASRPANPPQTTTSSSSEPVYSASARSSTDSPAPSVAAQSRRTPAPSTSPSADAPARQGAAARTDQTSNQLPATASWLPLAGLAGMLFIGSAVLLRLTGRL
jgi:hypothetical protein